MLKIDQPHNIRETCPRNSQLISLLASRWRWLTHHGLSSQIGVHLGNLVLVHLVQFGAASLLAVDDVFLQEILGDLLQPRAVWQLLQTRKGVVKYKEASTPSLRIELSLTLPLLKLLASKAQAILILLHQTGNLPTMLTAAL